MWCRCQSMFQSSKLFDTAFLMIILKLQITIRLLLWWKITFFPFSGLLHTVLKRFYVIALNWLFCLFDLLELVANNVFRMENYNFHTASANVHCTSPIVCLLLQVYAKICQQAPPAETAFTISVKARYLHYMCIMAMAVCVFVCVSTLNLHNNIRGKTKNKSDG